MDDPSPIWPILEALKDDPETYVTRSVANNLNDIAKDHPGAVIERCQTWSRDKSSGRLRLIQHGLRSLIKDGHPGALKVIGYGPPKNIAARLRLSPGKIALGQKVQVEAHIHNQNKKRQALLVDYALHFVRQQGKTSAKVFKWKKLELDPGESIRINKSHPMAATSIRALYPGKHQIELQINGERCATGYFSLQ